jgi:predicted metal-dependent hydrolase
MHFDAEDYDPLYLQGIAYFNACEFFEAHEVWEDLWKSYSGDLRLFYKGLIQAAVALHHFGNGNIRGARKVYRSSRGYLEQYQPTCCGLDVEKFIAEFDACFAEVAASQEEFPQIDINPELIPEITLDPPVELPAVDVER